MRDVSVRITPLVEDVPGVAELDLSPVFVRSQDVVAVDAGLRLTSPARPAHPCEPDGHPVSGGSYPCHADRNAARAWRTWSSA